MNDWHSCGVGLRFQLGDWTFFRVRLPLRVRTVRPIDEQPLDATLEVPSDPLPEGTQGYLFRSLPIATALPRISSVGGFLRYVPLQYTHGYIDLRTSFDAYQKRFSAKSRSTLKRTLRRYADRCGGTIAWRTYSTPEDMPEFFRLARLVSMRTYQEKLLAAGIPVTDEFLAGASSLAANQRVRAYILFDGERPVSYLYCPVENGVVIYRYLGFDPDYFRWSVGTMLFWLAIAQLFDERRFSHFDFTEGQGEQKRRFATHQRPCANVFFIKRTARNTILILSHLMLDACSRGLGSTLDHVGVKIKIKRLLRAGVPVRRSDFEGAARGQASPQSREEGWKRWRKFAYVVLAGVAGLAAFVMLVD